MRTEVVIVGAGIAGCAAAVLLARTGIPVLLIDDIQLTVSDKNHRLGESIPAAVVRLLHRLDLENVPTLLKAGEFRQCVANASSWGSDEWDYRYAVTNPEGPGWIVLRDRFDAALLKAATAAGASVKQGRVTGVDETDSGFSLEVAGSEQSVTCRYLLDATGRSAKLARLLGGRSEQFSQQVAAVAWFAPNSDPDGVIRICSHSKGWWYSSVLPSGERVVVFHGMPARIRELVRAKHQFVNSFNQCRVIDYDLDSRNLMVPLKTTDAGSRHIHPSRDSRLLAVGDAVLCFDPLTAQGIFFALYSSIFAAEAIINVRQGSGQQQEWSHYFRIVKNVSEHQRLLRRSFYLSETRYPEEEYWRTQQSV